MAVGVRTQDLRKVYNSAPPLGAAGGFIARADAKGRSSRKHKSQRSTDFRWRFILERSLACSVLTARANRPRSEC